MDNQRLLVWGMFGFLLFLTWQTWLEENAQPPVDASPSQSQSQALPGDGADPDVGIPDLPDVSAGPPDIAAPVESEIGSPATAGNRGTVIEVSTDVFDVEINTLGGTLQRAVLRVYPVAKDRPDDLIQLLSPEPDALGLVNTGLRLDGFDDQEEPNQFAQYEAERTSYDLGSGDEIRVPLTWTNDNGLRVVKTFVFRSGSYHIGVEQQLSNQGATALRGAPYASSAGVQLKLSAQCSMSTPIPTTVPWCMTAKKRKNCNATT